MAQFATMWEFVTYAAEYWSDPFQRQRAMDEIGDDINRKVTFIVVVETGLMPEDERPAQWEDAAFTCASSVLPNGAYRWVRNWKQQAIDEGIVAPDE
jgi:hypothetical protein